VADGRQQYVAAGLVGLGLDGEPHPVALVDRVLREQVDPLAVAVEGCTDVLGEVDLRALATAPEHVDLGPQLGGQVHVLHDLAQRVPAHAAVVAGEPAVLEDRVTEEVGRHHRHDQAGLGERRPELVDDALPLGPARPRRDEVVVVEGDAVRPQLGQLVHRLHAGQDRAGRLTEQVARLPADGPQAEAELVVAGGSGSHSASSFGAVAGRVRTGQGRVRW
jgi:hypothetical protein